MLGETREREYEAIFGLSILLDTIRQLLLGDLMFKRTRPRDTKKEAPVNDTIQTINADLSHSNPTIANTGIHWADNTTTRPELETQFEAMRARNWITDRMVQQYQKHWHCSRDAALERLLSKSDQ
jgi:hypothetical protein